MRNYFYYDEGMEYPVEAPYHPDRIYPEYPFSDEINTGKNKVYSAVRSIFAELGLDLEHMETELWNPMGGM